MYLSKEEKLTLIAESTKTIMDTLGIRVTESTQDTPKRVAKMYLEIFSGLGVEPYKDLMDVMKTFPNEGDSQEIKMKGIPFYSMCEHHLLPMYGKVDVIYKPNKKIIGLSKIPRVVKHYSRKPQLQERLTNDIASFLFNLLEPCYIEVKVYDVTHMCVSMRGIESECQTDTIIKLEK